MLLRAEEEGRESILIGRPEKFNDNVCQTSSADTCARGENCLFFRKKCRVSELDYIAKDVNHAKFRAQNSLPSIFAEQ